RRAGLSPRYPIAAQESTLTWVARTLLRPSSMRGRSQAASGFLLRLHDLLLVGDQDELLESRRQPLLRGVRGAQTDVHFGREGDGQLLEDAPASAVGPVHELERSVEAQQADVQRPVGNVCLVEDGRFAVLHDLDQELGLERGPSPFVPRGAL